MPDDKPTAELLEHTTRIVAAHVANNPIAAAELPSVIATVHQALAALGPEEAAPKPKPAVPIKQSVKPEYIVCLDDGKKLKMLKRHLRTAYNMTPAEYRERWGLPRDYPMVAPNYAKQRSALAKKIGLGRKPGTKVNARRKTKSPTKPKK
ncbi:MAG: MucR family transcriptional regulator [Acidobacteria bacterium]|nr:MucR family transcriptional regulator [Acidobacteriota bacterium]